LTLFMLKKIFVESFAPNKRKCQIWDVKSGKSFFKSEKMRKFQLF